MRKHTKALQQGFSAFEAIIIVIVIGAVGFAGWTVLNQQDDEVSNAPQPEAIRQHVKIIKNENDLQDAENELGDINLDDLDTSELDAAEEELL